MIFPGIRVVVRFFPFCLSEVRGSSFAQLWIKHVGSAESAPVTQETFRILRLLRAFDSNRFALDFNEAVAITAHVSMHRRAVQSASEVL
jgi:hypothetical protein